MYRIFIFSLIFFSYASFAQTHNVNKIKASTQLINGIHVAPNHSLTKVVPTSIVVNEDSNSSTPIKPIKKTTKKKRKSKYVIKKDEE